LNWPRDAPVVDNHRRKRFVQEIEMVQGLAGKRIAFLSTDGVEQSELTEPRDALEKAGAKTDLVSPAAGKIQAMQHHEKGTSSTWTSS
jgi:DJ-1/PfpI family protein